MCVLILSSFIIDRLSAGEAMAVNARGKVAGCYATLGTLLLLTLPVAWLMLRLGLDATSVGWACILTMLFCSAGRVYWAKRLVGLSVMTWVRRVLVPCFVVSGGSLLVGRLVQCLWGAPSVSRLCAVTAATLLTSVILGWCAVLVPPERTYLASEYARLLRRMPLRRPGRWGQKEKYSDEKF